MCVRHEPDRGTCATPRLDDSPWRAEFGFDTSAF